MCIKLKTLTVTNLRVREFLSEFIATFVLMVYGLTSVAQFVLGRGEYGTSQTVYWAWGVAVTMGVHTGGGISGSHLNPAITVAFCVVGKMDWRKIPHYFLGQYLGAFVASVFVYVIYYDALQEFDGGLRSVYGENATAMIWATYPHPGISIANCFLDQFLGTFMLLLTVMAIIDSRNTIVPTHLRPLLIGLLVFLHASTMSYNCACAINPARDLSPRIFTAIAGWGSDVFTYRDYYFWVPIVGPFLGAILGAVTYTMFIELHWPKEDRGCEIEVINSGKDRDTDVDSNCSTGTNTGVKTGKHVLKLT